MATKKTKAVVIAMAAMTGASIAQEDAAAQAAMFDMQSELGIKNVYSVNYTYDPFDGVLA